MKANLWLNGIVFQQCLWGSYSVLEETYGQCYMKAPDNNSKHFCSTNTVLYTYLSHLIFIITLVGQYYYLHFTDKETQAQRG